MAPAERPRFPGGAEWIVAHTEEHPTLGRVLTFALPDGSHARVLVGLAEDTPELRAAHGEALASGLVRVLVDLRPRASHAG